MYVIWRGNEKISAVLAKELSEGDMTWLRIVFQPPRWLNVFDVYQLTMYCMIWDHVEIFRYLIMNRVLKWKPEMACDAASFGAIKILTFASRNRFSLDLRFINTAFERKDKTIQDFCLGYYGREIVQKQLKYNLRREPQLTWSQCRGV